MNSEDLEKLSWSELEDLKAMQEKILEFTILNEKRLLEEDSKRRLEEERNKALDNLLLIQAEFKKRQS